MKENTKRRFCELGAAVCFPISGGWRCLIKPYSRKKDVLDISGEMPKGIIVKDAASVRKTIKILYHLSVPRRIHLGIEE